METLDVRGLSCPIPVLRTQKALTKGIEELLVIGSGNVAIENVARLTLSQGYQLAFGGEDADKWTIQITKPK